MNNTKIWVFSGFIILLVIGVTLGLVNYLKTNSLPNQNQITKNDPLNLTYKISGQDYTLINGKVEKEITPGSASKEVVQVFGIPVYGDLNNDGVDDAVMFLTQNSGGSGTFFYVVEAIKIDGTYKGTSAMLLGDRIAPQNINILNGQAVANFVERKPGESFAVRPSEGRSVYIKLDQEKMDLGEVVQNFEGEADPSKMTLGMKTWQWVSATYSDGKKIVPKTDKFKITFKTDGTFSASTDCNGIGGEYVTKNNTITFSKMMSTLMYCEGSQEQDFSKVITEANSFLFTSKGELVLNLKLDSGSAVFK